MKTTILSLFTCCLAALSTSHAQLGSLPVKPTLNPCIVQSAPAAIRAMYVSKADDIINKTPPLTFGEVNGDVLLNWADGHNFNYLILYGISGELNTNEAAFTPKLAAFIKKAHEEYDIKISINVASHNSATRLEDYLNSAVVLADDAGRLDAIHYEAEYWNGASGIVFDDGTGDDYESQLAAIYNLCQTNEVDCETYIGNPTHGPDAGSWNPNPADPDNIQGQLEIDYINQKTDRIYVAYYKSTPFSPSGNAFQSKKYRFGFLQNSAYQSDIVVLFNSNNSSPDPNMYAWLNGQPGIWQAKWPRPYNIWMNCHNGYDDHGTAGTDNVNVQGYCWYRFQNLRNLTLWATHVVSPKEMAAHDEITIYPNPADQQLYIQMPIDSEVNAMRILNVAGEIVKELDHAPQIDVDELMPGTYFLQIDLNGREQVIKRFQKQ